MFWRWVELLSLLVAALAVAFPGPLFYLGLLDFQHAVMLVLGGIGLLLMLLLRSRPSDRQQEPEY